MYPRQRERIPTFTIERANKVFFNQRVVKVFINQLFNLRHHYDQIIDLIIPDLITNLNSGIMKIINS